MPRTRGSGKPTQLANGKWRIRWSDQNNDRQSGVFDSYRGALREQRKHEREVQEILDGERAAPPPKRRFDELCDRWLERRTKRKASQKDDKSIIRKHLRPTFGSSVLGAMSQDLAAIDDFKDDLLECVSKKTCSNILTLLISMMNQAEDWKWILKAPKIKKPRVVLFDRDYRWLRTTEEIARFLDASRHEGELVHALYSTATYTGMRAGELAGLEWPDLDFERRLIRVQRSFRGPTKTGHMRWVPIVDVLLPTLRAWRLRNQGPVLFPNHAGRMQSDSSANIFQQVLHRVLKRAELPTIEREGKTQRYITFHSLRHTFASHWMMRGASLFKLQRILGHRTIAMTERYAHLRPEAFAEELGLFGPPVESATVLPFPGAFGPAGQ